MKNLNWQNVLLFIAIAFLAFVIVITINMADLDLWARLFIGSIFHQTGAVLMNDIFAFVPTKELFVDHEWGASAVFYFIAQRFNDIGLMVFKFIMILAVFFIIYYIIKTVINKKTLPIEPIYFLIIAKALADSADNPVRSELFTFVFFALWILVLEKARRDKNFRLLWILPATTLFWANMHGGFVAGLGILFLYTLGEFLNNIKGDRKIAFAFGFTILSSLLATFINPYGAKNFWSFIIHATTMQRPDIIDFKPMPLFYTDPILSVNYTFWAYKILLFLTLAVAMRLIIKKTKPDWTKILLFGATIFLSIKHVRHDYFFYIATATLYPYYVELFSPLSAWIKTQFPQNRQSALPIIKNVLSYVLIIAFCYSTFKFYNPRPLWRMAIYPNKYPIGSVEFLVENNIKGRLLSHYGWGSYQFWKLYPNNLVAMDGRYEEVYPDEIYKLIRTFYEKEQNWENIPEKISAEIIITSKNNFSPQELAQLKNWQVVYEDKSSMVLLPKDKVKKKYIYPDWKDSYKYWLQDFSRGLEL